MQKSIIYLVFIAGLIGCSQQSNENNAEGLREKPSETAQVAEAPQHSMTGCVQRGDAPDSFFLTDEVGLRFAQVRGSNPELGPHVGHKVEITGSPVKGSQLHTMEVTEVKMLSPTCL